MGGAINIVASALIALIWVCYGSTFIFTKTDHLDLEKDEQTDKRKLNGENRFFTNGFGDFREVSRQISKEKKPEENKLQKVYLILFLERILSSVVIVFLGPLVGCGSGIIMGVYVILLVVLIVGHAKLKSNENGENKVKVFSHLYRNYVLRQSLNFLSIILIQVLLMCGQIMLTDTGNSEEFLSKSEVTLKVIPALVLCLMVVNMIANIIFFIWEIRNS